MSLYKRPDSDIWWFNISVAGQPRSRGSTGEIDRQAAQRVHDQHKAELWKRPKALTGKTWLNAVAKWMDFKDPSYTELLGIQKFNLYFGDCKLADITPDRVDQALKKFTTNPATYNRHRARVSGILKLSDVIIKLDPPRKVKAKEREWLTHEQWDKLKAELPPHMLAMATFAISTGLRQANVLNLTWSKVDLGRKLVWIEGSESKSKKAIAVPLSIEAINVLITVQGQHPEFCFTFRGKPVSEIKTAFRAATRRAEIPSFTWHGFRHTWATWHVQNGTPLDVLQKLGGWADYTMVLRYGHHAPGYLAKFADNTGLRT